MDNSVLHIIESIVWFSIFPMSVGILVGYKKLINMALGFSLGLIIVLVLYLTLTSIYEIVNKLLN